MHAILSPPGDSAGDWGNNAERKALVLLCEACGIPETAVQFMSFQEWHTNIAICSESNVSILSDWMSYRWQDGIEDTRQALCETRQPGIHPFRHHDR